MHDTSVHPGDNGLSCSRTNLELQVTAARCSQHISDVSSDTGYNNAIVVTLSSKLLTQYQTTDEFD